VSLPEDLIRSALLASAEKPVTFVLEDASRPHVDRLLDNVAHRALGFAGVVYCRPDELEGFLAEHGDPEFAVIHGQHLRRLLARRSVRLMSQAGATRALRRLSCSSGDQ
jgi:hypothetical protein